MGDFPAAGINKVFHGLVGTVINIYKYLARLKPGAVAVKDHYRDPRLAGFFEVVVGVSVERGGDQKAFYPHESHFHGQLFFFFK
ncbi:hypothetical protein D9M69_566810 [compost metagenome]